MAEITINSALFQADSWCLSSALALSLVTGRAFNFSDYKVGGQSGFSSADAALIKAAADISNAAIIGGAIGQDSLTFTPGEIKSGLVMFTSQNSNNIGQTLTTVFPALARQKSPSLLKLQGVTHLAGMPTVDYLAECYFPLLSQMGGHYDFHTGQRGFYPVGGGKIQLDIHPAVQHKPLKLLERGALIKRKLTVINANLPGHIAERELAVAHSRLGWPAKECHIVFDNSPTTGNVINLALYYENLNMLVSGVGQRGVRAEKVAEDATAELIEYMQSVFPVSEKLTYQLIIPMLALGGGEFLAPPLSQECQVLLNLAEAFAPGHVAARPQNDGTVVTVRAL